MGVVAFLQMYEIMKETIHGIDFEIKEIPDPIEGTALDPRVYEYRKSQKEMTEAPGDDISFAEILRREPAYPNRDVTSIRISKEKRKITTSNGDTDIFIFRPERGRIIKPAMIYFHGGAFVAGHTEVVENFCRLICEKADAVVIGVDYALAPEHPFPQGVNDCYETFLWAFNHAKELEIDAENISVGGDSAGGTMAIDCCLLEREAHRAGKTDRYRISFEALLYPAVLVNDVRLADYRWKLSDYDLPMDDTLAMEAIFELKVLDSEIAKCYMGTSEKITDPLAAPLCQDSLEGLPRTLLAICQWDYLRLSGEAFGRKLKESNVICRNLFYKGMDHGFVDKIGDCPQALDLAEEIAKEINRYEEKPV